MTGMSWNIGTATVASDFLSANKYGKTETKYKHPLSAMSRAVSGEMLKASFCINNDTGNTAIPMNDEKIIIVPTPACLKYLLTMYLSKWLDIAQRAGATSASRKPFTLVLPLLVLPKQNESVHSGTWVYHRHR